MSDPKWTPELQARCLEVARAARTEPETVESLRDALVASEAARVAAEERARALGAVVTAVRAHHAAMSRLDDHVERMDCYDTECRHASHEEESEAKAAVDVLLRAYPAPAATAKAPA